MLNIILDLARRSNMNEKISENDVGNSAAALANRKYPCFEKLGGSVVDDCCMVLWLYG
jgi:hypothetical protein